jgi:aminopeptidase N
MWVHEGFANYSETLYTECNYGKEAALEYVSGIRKLIANDIPIIGQYGVNQEGSGDMYYKGGNMIHNIRSVIGNDEKFRQILRGLNKDFYHKTVSTQDVEQYISKKAGTDFSKVFDQYLRTTQIPTLEYYFIADTKDKSKSNLFFRWTTCVPGFNMPLKINVSKSEQVSIMPTEAWKSVTIKLKDGTNIINPNFYINWKQTPR